MSIRLLVTAALLAQAAAPAPPPKPLPPLKPDPEVRLDPASRTYIKKSGVPQTVQIAPRKKPLAFVSQAPKGERDVVISGSFFPMALGLLPDKPVEVDLENASVQDAVRQVVERSGTKADVVIDADVPADARVTVRAKGIRPSTALDLIAQSAGVNWAVERKGDKTALRVGKSVRPGFATSARTFTNLVNPGNLVLPPGTGLGGLRFPTAIRQYTFSCPHCKGQATVVRRQTQPNCPKCNRLFQADWQFCPADGTKRPPQANDWKFCPICGKRVEVEKASFQPADETDGLTILQELPIAGPLFRSEERIEQRFLQPAPEP